MTETAHDTAPLVANRQAIAKHLYQLFSPAFVLAYPDSWIEIAYGRPDGPLNKASNFPAFKPEEAIDFAIKQNAAGNNVYVGPALRHGVASATGRANKANVLDSSHAFVDYDAAGDDERIQEVLKVKLLTPAMVITTGTVPHFRRHLYFRFDGSVTPDQLEAANASLKNLLGSDDVQNADRLMRLAGTVNHPSPDKQKRGYVAELVTIRSNPTAPAYKIEALIGLAPVSGENNFTKHGKTSSLGLKFAREDSEIEALLKASQVKNWHNNMRDAVASMVGQRWSDSAIKFACAAYCRGGAGDADLIELIETARKKFDKPEVQPDTRPTIQVAGGNLPQIVTQAEQALIAGNFSLYQRGSLIVKPSPVPVDIADNRTTTAIRLAAVRTHLLVELMTRAATWQRFDIRKNDWVAIDCPERVANTLLAREEWGLPVLSGIVNCPVLRADGSVLDKPGYDAATGLLYDPQGVKFRPVPENPDIAAAKLALAVLKDLISTFPFVTDADRSVALSAILTALHRRSLQAAPLHGFSAPGAGSGKSKLVDIASLIVDGREAAVMSLGRSEEEAEKRLGAALLAGDAIVSIDNIDPERAFGGELFCMALTQRMLKIRMLGYSKNVEVPTNAALFANGNNLTLIGDMTRRAIMCNIDSGEERPELRVFDRNPLAMVRADRNKYVIAALTVLKALYVAKPLLNLGSSITPLGSFEEWSDLIRCGLIYLGEADPCDTMEKIRKKDPRLGAAITVVSQWLEVVGHRGSVTAKDMINHAIEETASPFQYQSRSREYKHPEFRDALLIVAGDGGAINSLKLGRWLAANENRSILGHKIIQNGERGGSKLWKLEPKVTPDWDVSAEDKTMQPRF
jgi:hypothetical protein